MRHKGSCQCGKVAFEVEGEIKEALACNCSICRCVEGIDLASIQVKHFDGKAL